MMQRRKQSAIRGVTLVELLISVGIASWIMLMAAKYFQVPARLGAMMANATNEETTYHSTAMPVNDLKAAISASIQWPLIDPSQPNPPYVPAFNSQYMPWFQINDPTIDAPALPVSYVCYTYRTSDQALVRYFISGAVGPVVSSNTLCSPEPDDFAQETVVVRNMLPPTPEDPLFSKDLAALNMVTVTMRFNGPKNTIHKIVRRIHLRT